MGLLEFIGLKRTDFGRPDDFEIELVEKFDIHTRAQYFREKGMERELRRTAEAAMGYGFGLQGLERLAGFYDLSKVPVKKRMKFAKHNLKDKQQFDSICEMLGLGEESRQKIIDGQIEFEIEYPMRDGINKLKADYGLSDEHIAAVARKAKKVNLVWMKRLGIMPQEEIERRYFKKVLKDLTEKRYGHFDSDSFISRAADLGISDERAEGFLLTNIDKLINYSFLHTIKEEAMQRLCSKFSSFGKAMSLAGQRGYDIKKLAETYHWTQQEMEDFAVRQFNKYGISSESALMYYAAISDKRRVIAKIESFLDDPSVPYHAKIPLIERFIPEQEQKGYQYRIRQQEEQRARRRVRYLVSRISDEGRISYTDLDDLYGFKHMPHIVREEAQACEPLLKKLTLELASESSYSRKAVDTFIDIFGIHYSGFDTVKKLQQMKVEVQEMKPTGNGN